MIERMFFVPAEEMPNVQESKTFLIEFGKASKELSRKKKKLKYDRMSVSENLDARIFFSVIDQE